MSCRPAGRVPKPNTRFLKNVIRDADTHNANLKRKEEDEARERMRRLRPETSQRAKTESNSENVDGREPKRRRVESSREHTRERERIRTRRSRHHHDREESPEESRRRDLKSHRRERTQDETARGTEPVGEPPSKTTRRREDRQSEKERDRHARRRHSKRDVSKERPRDAEPTGDGEKRHSRKSRRSSRSRSPPRKRSHSRDHARRRGTTRRSEDGDTRSHGRTPTAEIDGNRGADQPETPTLNPPPKETRPADTESRHDPDSEDDPLSNLIGPLPPSASDYPPSRCRGRGAYKTNGSNIDTHFAAGYDPALDVHLNDDGKDEDEKRIGPDAKIGYADDIDNDWDMALEALQDRAVWRRKGAERLRQAGFEDNVVERWSNSANFLGLRDDGGGANSDKMKDVRDKGLADMRWAKKGEGREWDRGKVVDDEGHVDVKAPW